MKKFCEDLRKYETEIITHKKKDVTANERRKRITLHKFVIYVKKSWKIIMIARNDIINYMPLSLDC